MKFNKLGLSTQLEEGLDMMGFEIATPIQEKAIPIILKGKDLIACAQTGTGKTAAFVLPILSMLSNKKQSDKVKVLIIAPTRELAKQIDMQIEGFSYYTNSSSYPIYGGGTGPEFENQKQALVKGTDIIICTPGRLMAHLKFDYFDSSSVNYLILDEADRMLDMGFIRDIKKVLKILPKDRQNLLFSATMPSSIADLANSFLINAEMIDLSPKEITVDRIEQSILFVRKEDKIKLIIDIIKENKVQRGIIFTRTKHGANKLVKKLDRANISALAIHGNKSQGARTRALSQFKNGTTPLLVATDIASRGIDVDNVTHVFNYDLPNEPESYVHRIGRTARAGKSGTAYSFCDDSESGYLVGIQRLIGKKIPVIEDHPYHFIKAIPKPNQKPGKIKNSKDSGKSRNNNNNNKHRSRRKKRNNS